MNSLSEELKKLEPTNRKPKTYWFKKLDAYKDDIAEALARGVTRSAIHKAIRDTGALKVSLPVFNEYCATLKAPVSVKQSVNAPKPSLSNINGKSPFNMKNNSEL